MLKKKTKFQIYFSNLPILTTKKTTQDATKQHWAKTTFLLLLLSQTHLSRAGLQTSRKAKIKSALLGFIAGEKTWKSTRCT